MTGLCSAGKEYLFYCITYDLIFFFTPLPYLSPSLFQPLHTPYFSSPTSLIHTLTHSLIHTFPLFTRLSLFLFLVPILPLSHSLPHSLLPHLVFTPVPLTSTFIPNPPNPSSIPHPQTPTSQPYRALPFYNLSTIIHFLPLSLLSIHSIPILPLPSPLPTP